MRRVVLGAVALLLVPAGCGGDPKADPTPSTSPSTVTVSTSPSPTAPAIPDAAKANTKAGAIAFVRYYVDLINHAQATGDVEALQSVELPGCRSCQRGRSYLSGIYKTGGHIEGGTWTLRTATAKRSGRNWAVTVTGRFAPSDAYPTPGARPRHSKGGPTLTNFIVAYAQAWKVRAWFSG